MDMITKSSMRIMTTTAMKFGPLIVSGFLEGSDYGLPAADSSRSATPLQASPEPPQPTALNSLA